LWNNAGVFKNAVSNEVLPDPARPKKQVKVDLFIRLVNG
jgi:hypothetical protein